MFQVVLAIHIIICIALVGSILLQRSEGGGALGIGGGPSGLMSGRSAANFMTRTTSILAFLFFGTSIALTVLASGMGKPTSSVMETGKSKNGLPTNGIDLSTAAPANAVAPTNDTGAIPESTAAPLINGLGTGFNLGQAAPNQTNTVNQTK